MNARHLLATTALALVASIGLATTAAAATQPDLAAASGVEQIKKRGVL